MEPFEGLSPAPSTDHARWVYEGIDREGERVSVGWYVPRGYDAYVRVLNPGDEPWQVIDPVRLRRADGLSFFESHLAVEGEIDEAVLSLLIIHLARHTAPQEICHFQVWAGWGFDNRAWGGSGDNRAVTAFTASGVAGPSTEQWRQDAERRTMAVVNFLRACARGDDEFGNPWWFYVDGPMGYIRNIGNADLGSGVGTVGVHRWWPGSRSWLVATDIDDEWTYVGGSRHLVDELLADPLLDTVEVDWTDSW